MATNKRRSVTRVRRDYGKLGISTGLEVLSGSAGLTQVYKDNEFSPDHAVTPLVLTPTVSVKAEDITPPEQWTVGTASSNSGVGGKAWLVGGKAISSVWTEGTDYETSDDGKTLYIYRNIPYPESVSISCCLLVYDSRTGVTVAVETDPVALATVAVAGDTLRMSADMDNMLWCPEADDLWEWDYRNARGYTQLMTKTAATNDGCYLKTVNLCVTEGNKQLTSGYGIVIKDADGTNLLTSKQRNIENWTNNMPQKVSVSNSEEVNSFAIPQTVGGWEGVYIPITLEKGKTYTLSCKYSVASAYELLNSYTFGLEIANAALTTETGDNRMCVIPFPTTVCSEQSGSITFTATQETGYLGLNGGHIADGQTGLSFTVSDIKLEESIVASITADGTLVNNRPEAVMSLTLTSITFDCRAIGDEYFKVYALNADGAIEKETLCTLHVHTTHRDYDAPEPVNHSDYTLRQTKYRNRLRVRINGEEVEHPECWLDILWYTQSAETNSEEEEVGAGDTCCFNPNVAGGGATQTDNGFLQIAATDYLPSLSVATDGTDAYVDESGNLLLI